MPPHQKDFNLSLNSYTMQTLPSFFPHTHVLPWAGSSSGGEAFFWPTMFIALSNKLLSLCIAEWGCPVLCLKSRVAIAASPMHMQSRIALSMQRVEEGRGNLPSKSCHSLSGLDPPPSPFSKEITTAVTNISMREGAK